MNSITRIIILNSLEVYTKKFSETRPPSRLYEIEMKIKILEIENDNFKQYLDNNLNSLFYRIQ
ncbi:hypothetical protein U3516DRAFT_737595 [Neocallimastix sp. 'constans']